MITPSNLLNSCMHLLEAEQSCHAVHKLFDALLTWHNMYASGLRGAAMQSNSLLIHC